MSKTKLNTVIFGLGRIASLLESDPYRKKPCTHAGVIFSPWGKKRFQFLTGFDLKEDRVRAFQTQWKTRAELFGTINPKHWDKNLVQSVDLAVIATPSAQHESIARFCIQSGVKHLLIEKPVALEKKGAERLQKLAEGSRAKIWVNHERRYHPSYQFVRDGLGAGKYGEVMSVRCSVFTSAKNPGLAFEKVGGGPLLHDGTHILDLVQWMFGKPKLVDAEVWRPSPKSLESRAWARFQGKNGEAIFVDVSGGREYFQFEMDIHTTSHRLICSNDGFQFFESKPSKLYKGFQSLLPFQPKGFPNPETSNAFIGIYDEIHRVFSQKTQKLEGTISDNIDILDMIESIYRRKK
ncbi:Gfo/Idh/MocA family oxidoreductase [Leptospira sp. 96542]|nr:Gfo/Idh/MocA family oxidoreductase [Leptospira sp. 96542]